MKGQRIVRIVNDYFAPYNHTVTNDDVEYVMEFLKIMLIKKGLFKPRCC